MGFFSKIGGAIKGVAKGGLKIAKKAAIPVGLSLATGGLSNLGGLAGLLGVGKGLLGGGEGGGGITGFLGGLLEGVGGGSKGRGVLNLGMLGADLLGSSKQRKSSQAFEQKRLDALTNFIAQGEAEFARKAPLREGGQTAILQAIGNLGSSPVARFLKESRDGTRAAGEFKPRKKKEKVAA